MVATVAESKGYSVPLSTNTSCYTKWKDLIYIDVYKKYLGAYVPAPKSGAYVTPVVALDFASLYPSIIIANNLSPETITTNNNISDIKHI